MIDKEFIAGRIRDVRNFISDLKRLASSNFESLSIDELYSIRYRIVALVEGLVSLCHHIAHEAYGYEPSSYRDCLDYVCKRERTTCAESLKGLVGLRNLLIHRYFVIDDRKVHKAVGENLKCLEEFLQKVMEKYG